MGDDDVIAVRKFFLVSRHSKLKFLCVLVVSVAKVPELRRA